MHKFPVIGLTLDAEEPGGYSKFPWYALRQNYFTAVREAGGLPIALPHDAAAAAAYLALCDGILVTGGAFDVDPALAVKTRRTLFDRFAADNTKVFGYHMPWPALARITKRGDGYEWTAEDLRW